MGRQRRRIARRAVPAMIAATLAAGCALPDLKPTVQREVAAVRKGPEALPMRTITNFSTALRCMDGLLLTYGIRELPVIVEDLADQTKKVNAGTKDMLISAVSQMTRRSKGIRLITYGKDSGNYISLIESVQGRNAFKQVPPYGLRGSVSQLDDNLARFNADAGIALDPHFSAGVAKNAAASVLALDLNVVSGRDLGVVSGVTSHNAVVIYREGTGADADASIRKFGINFSMTLARSEGQSQALRNLVELAAVEIFGKLGMLPYWRCLGSAGDESVGAEVEDWFHALGASGNELVQYFQYQLRLRGWYWGPQDGQRSATLDEAVAGYRQAIGLAADGGIDAAFFRGYIEADHAAVMAKHPPPTPPAAAAPTPVTAAPAAPAPPAAPPVRGDETPRPAAVPEPAVAAEAPAPSAAPSTEPLRVAVQGDPRVRTLRRGDAFEVAVMTNRAAHVYCYFRDEHQRVQRIFPNRFDPQSLVRPTHPLTLPGTMRFQLLASPRGVTEAVVCYATSQDVLARLPGRVAGRDFENLPVANLEEVKQAFRNVVNSDLAEGVFHVRVN